MRSIRMWVRPRPKADLNAALAESGPEWKAPGERTTHIYWFDPAELRQKRRFYRLGRRVQDIVLSLAALVLLSPFLGAVALAIWLDSPGASPLFVQQRVGRDGRLFRLWKFRSMVPDAEARLESLLDQNEMDGPVFKMKHDPRITRVGRWIRSTSIDELPQLINVLRGEMSLVGPRPSPMGNEATYTGGVRKKFAVRPGITGYNQALLRNSASLEERYRNDLYYVEHVSFRLDAKILLLTAKGVLFRQNVYRRPEAETGFDDLGRRF